MRTASHSHRKHLSHHREGTSLGDEEKPIVKLVEALQKVKTDTPEAKLNETSMGDNNGGRIKYRGRRKPSERRRPSH